MPKVSVVIPVYRVEGYIEECIDSVLKQTLGDIEVIAVDDGSPDSSGSILDRYAEEDHRVTVIHKRNEGVSAARNDGLERCSGDYIYIMDSDDYLEPDALEKMVACAEENQADVVIMDHFTFREDGIQRPHHFFSQPFVTSDRETIMQLQRMVLHSGYSPYYTPENTGLGISTPWTKLLKASLVTDNGLTFDPYVRGIFDDGLFALHVFEHAKKTAYIRDQVYHYRILPGSIIHRFHPDRLATDRRVFEKILEFAEKNKKGEAFRKAYEAKVVQFWVRSFAVYFFHRDYPGNSRQNYREFISTAKSAPYREAIRAVDPGILKKIQRYCVRLSRMHLNPVIWLAFRIYRMASGDRNMTRL